VTHCTCVTDRRIDNYNKHNKQQVHQQDAYPPHEGQFPFRFILNQTTRVHTQTTHTLTQTQTKLEINMHHLRGNAIPAGHVQKRFSLNLLSLRDSKNVPKIFLNFS